MCPTVAVRKNDRLETRSNKCLSLCVLFEAPSQKRLEDDSNQFGMQVGFRRTAWKPIVSFEPPLMIVLLINLKF
ncbi:hypothetical protein BpHYR1_032788 [Brachionus plicatilis]|uniref:Uncharacterized protein n=1 Tax=Brachionus plicatilis TaxID=10195 RepID=A0A3M7STE8_BRAPC|nr:hypothetical protein BpHYR1_032788 [Brachionus plicatilis]